MEVRDTSLNAERGSVVRPGKADQGLAFNSAGSWCIRRNHKNRLSPITPALHHIKRARDGTHILLVFKMPNCHNLDNFNPNYSLVHRKGMADCQIADEFFASAVFASDERRCQGWERTNFQLKAT